MSDYRTIGQAPISSNPDKKYRLKLKEDSVGTEHIKEGAVTSSKLHDDIWADVISRTQAIANSMILAYNEKMAELEALIRSVTFGSLVVPEFGDSDVIGVSQSTLTDAINALNTRINDILGVNSGIMDVIVTPEYSITEDTFTISVSSIASDNDYLYDSVHIYFNNVEVTQYSHVNSFSFSQEVSETTDVKVVGKIMGTTYEKTVTVTKYYPFFVGCGTSYEDIMTPDNIRDWNGDPTGRYTVSCSEGDRIYVIVPISKASLITDIEMGDLNIPGMSIPGMSEYTEDDGYAIYESTNTYVEGEYVIEINS